MTFRELFDEQDREEIVAALQARLGRLEGSIKLTQRGERTTSCQKERKLEARREYLADLLSRVAEECN